MFYRWRQGDLVPVDLNGLFQGESLFVLGGNPVLKDLPVDLLTQPGITTLALNNACCVVRPNLWLGVDHPECFVPQAYTDPGVVKFTGVSRSGARVPGTGQKVRDCPGFFFFGVSEDFTYQTFLDDREDFVWWQSVFPIALQLAYRLGFRRVNLVGCGFNMNREAGKQYAWDTSLSEDQVRYSLKTYQLDLCRLLWLQPVFACNGLKVTSCTPGSLANSFLPFLPLEEAVRQSLDRQPDPIDTKELRHSSEFKGHS